MSIDSIVRPAGVTQPAEIAGGQKLVPVVSTAAMLAVIGATQAQDAPLGKDKLVTSYQARIFSGTVTRFGSTNQYALSGNYNGTWFRADIDQGGGQGSPITVTGITGPRLNLVINDESSGFTVIGNVDGKNVALSFRATGNQGAGYSVSGVVGANLANLNLTGQLNPSARYNLFGTAGRSTLNVNVDENGTNGGQYTVGGLIN